jgi:hypothetical protein
VNTTILKLTVYLKDYCRQVQWHRTVSQPLVRRRRRKKVAIGTKTNSAKLQHIISASL